MYDHLMVPVCETYRIRCLGIDRRGFGESDWIGANAKASNITYETFADDTIYILQQLKLEDFIFVAASMGCGETVLAWERSTFVKERCKVSPFCSAPPSYLRSYQLTVTCHRASSGSDLPYHTRCRQQRTPQRPPASSGIPSLQASAHPVPLSPMRPYQTSSAPTLAQESMQRSWHALRESSMQRTHWHWKDVYRSSAHSTSPIN